MGRMSHRNQERTERRISAAASLMLCALTVLAQIAVTLLLTRFLKEKASFVYGFLQLIGAAVAIRVYQRSGSPSYKLSWMCLLLILPVAGMLLFCLWGGTHQAKQLSLKPVPPIPQRESAKMLKFNGRFYMVHRPFRLAEIFSTMMKYHIEPKRMRLVHPYADREPNMVLIEGLKGGKSRITIEKPLVVYKEPNVYTDEIYEIYGDKPRNNGK